MTANVRICFIGDSFVQGVGDPEYLGWVGRVLRASPGEITAFNLGVRRNTSEDVRHRWRQEVLARTAPEADNRLVVSFGSNDAVEENGRPRVDPSRSVDNLASILDGCRHHSITPLVVGPPPVVDAGEGHLRRLSDLAAKMASLCAEHRVPFIPVTRELAADPVWTAEALAGDGAHPAAGGYHRLAALVLDSSWRQWVVGPGPVASGEPPDLSAAKNPAGRPGESR